MPPTPRTRLGATAIGVAGLFFVAYVAFRPWRDETTQAGATASMSSSWWVAAHLFAMVGFVLLPLGLLALRDAVRGTRGERVGLAALVTTWIGAGLTLPYYGAEDFGLNAIARRSVEGQPLDLLDLADAVRFSPAAATTFVVGLLALGAGAVLTAVAVWRSGVLARSSGILFAVAFALFIPQFFAGAPVRVAHGVVVAAGSAWLAWALWHRRAATVPTRGPHPSGTGGSAPTPDRTVSNAGGTTGPAL